MATGVFRRPVGIQYRPKPGHLGTLSFRVLNGAFDVTEEGDTLASAGTLSLVADAAITEEGDILDSAGGAIALIADAAITEAGDTLVSAGTLPLVASAAITEEGDTLASAGTLSTLDVYHGIYVHSAGTFTNEIAPYGKLSGTWKAVIAAYAKQDGSWKQIWTS